MSQDADLIRQPQEFTDNKGRTWRADLNMHTAQTVLECTGVDLINLLTTDLAGLGETLADIRQAVNVLFCLVADQADAQGVSDEDFGRALAGDAIEDACEALVEALAAFLSSDSRELFLQVVAAGRKMHEDDAATLRQAIAKAVSEVTAGG